MGNTKPIGVAYSDPDLDSVSVAGTATIGALSAGSIASTAASGRVAGPAGSTPGFYSFTTAITANTTVTTAPAGSMAVTSNATGVGKLFVSDGAKWQFGAIT